MRKHFIKALATKFYVWAWGLKANKKEKHKKEKTDGKSASERC